MAAGAMLYVVETSTEATAVAPAAHAFTPKPVALGASGFALTVPRLPGMTELVVDRAALTLTGVVADLPEVVLDAPALAQTQKLAPPAGTSGALRRLRIEGLSLALADAGIAAGTVVDLANSGDGPAAFTWTVGATPEFSAGAGAASDKLLHFIFFPLLKSGSYGTPCAAAPLYDQPFPPPGNTPHAPLLGGARVLLDTPPAGATSGSFTIDLDPTLSVQELQVSVFVSDLKDVSPFTGTRVKWGAAKVRATWATGPRKSTLAASPAGAGAPPPATLAAVDDELLRSLAIDFTPAARALLGALHASGTGDLIVTLAATAKSAGTFLLGDLSVAARYRSEPAPPDGLPVQLRGAPASVRWKVPPGVAPAAITWTIDGRFGRNALVTAADPAPSDLRSGLQVAGSTWVARRMAIARPERGLPLSRVSLFGRATGPTDLVLTLHDGDERHVGARLGKPIALSVTPSSSPDWWRADLAKPPFPPPAPEAIWVVAHAAQGVFWWYGASGPGPAQTSADAGGTWIDLEGGPALQLHVTTDPEAAPLALARGGGTPVVADLLAPEVPSLRARVQRSQLQAARLGALAQATAAPAGAFAMFRKEGLALLTPAEIAAAGGELVLTFSSTRDADFRILSVTLDYDPWPQKHTRKGGRR